MNFSKLRIAAIFSFVVLLSTTAFSQTLFLRETFPTNTSGTNDDFGDDHTVAGDLGSWTVATSADIRNYVAGTTFVSSPSALILQTQGSGAQSSTISSANINLSGVNAGICAANGIVLKFQLRRNAVTTGHNLAIEFSNNGGGSYTVAQANALTSITANNQWVTVAVTVPNTHWVNNFRVRFNFTRTTSDDVSVFIDDVVITDPTVPDFSGAFTETSSGGSGFAAGDVYRFNSVVTSPADYYAEVTIEAISNAQIDVFDNNDVGVANRFQPRIMPNAALNADREGYVQFAITFKKTSDNTVAALEGLRYRHYDIDGSQATGTNAYTFRETGWITGAGSILVNSPSDLTDAGSVVNGGFTWRKILGELAEHDGLSSDPDVVFTAAYGTVSTVRFRLGYAFDEISGSTDLGQPSREYGTEFGCFNLSTQIPLPVKLLSFTGSYRNNVTTLNWETVNEQLFDRFEVERSSNGADFTTIGIKPAAASNYSAKQGYQFLDDLSAANGSVFYYRLKMIDTDGKYKHSSVIMIRKEGKTLNGIAVNPSPVVNGIATVRFSSSAKATVDFRVVDMQGRVVLQQQNKVYEGNNSISLNNLSRLQPGVYTLQMVNGAETEVVKFAVAK
jgi:hypothetical protein